MQPCAYFTRDMEPGPRAQPSSGIDVAGQRFRVSFIGAVLATAIQKLNREKANVSFQEQVVACGRIRRVGGLDGRICARSLIGECG